MQCTQIVLMLLSLAHTAVDVPNGLENSERSSHSGSEGQTIESRHAPLRYPQASAFSCKSLPKHADSWCVLRSHLLGEFSA